MRRRLSTGCDYHGYLMFNEISHQCRQSIVLTFRPAVLDGHVLSLDVAGFVEAFPKRGQPARGVVR